MERSSFLKNGIAALGAAFVVPLIHACKKDAVAGTIDTGTTTGAGKANGHPTDFKHF